MTISVLSWARNEADILEAWVRHHSVIADAIHITLHRTRDNSEEILRALKEEGLPVSWTTDERALHEQDIVLSGEMHRLASAGGWILPLDLDEFVTGDIAHELGKADGNRVIRLPMRGYVPLPDDPQQEPNVLRRITHRRRTEQPEWQKICIPSSLIRTGDRIAAGNHRLLDATGTAYPSERAARSAIAHFPVRSAGQLRRKVLCGWQAAVHNPRHGQGEAFQWKELYDRLASGEMPDRSELSVIALEYCSETQWQRMPAAFTAGVPWQHASAHTPDIVHDPVPCSFTLRYPVREADTEAVIRENLGLFSASVLSP